MLGDPGCANIDHAFRRPEWRCAHRVALQPDPSAIADIEGALIHIAEDMRSLSVLPLA